MSKIAAPPAMRLSRHDAPLRGRDGGQAAILVIVVSAMLLVAVVVALGAVGRTAVDRTRAQTAADAAALASLEGGRGDAVMLAERHGTTLVHWYRGPGPSEVTVTVRRGETTATARTSNAP